jgi:hypothetical protein
LPAPVTSDSAKATGAFNIEVLAEFRNDPVSEPLTTLLPATLQFAPVTGIKNSRPTAALGSITSVFLLMWALSGSLRNDELLSEHFEGVSIAQLVSWRESKDALPSDSRYAAEPAGTSAPAQETINGFFSSPTTSFSVIREYGSRDTLIGFAVPDATGTPFTSHSENLPCAISSPGAAVAMPADNALARAVHATIRYRSDSFLVFKVWILLPGVPGGWF